MTAPGGSPREAVERTARAVMTGNLAQVMADLAPEALAQLMQLASGAQGLSPAQLPSIDRYEVTEVAAGDAEAIYRVAFVSSMGSATIETTWRPMLGQWKVAAVSLVSAEVSPGGS